MKLIVISGLSGSGKTVALHTLEDEEYYCVDNLPPPLLPMLVEELKRGAHTADTKTAVGIDARANTANFQNFPEYLQSLKTGDIEVETVFLDAADETLIKRFSETRRRHPLSHHGLPLADAIQRERELLSAVREHADLIIDTTSRTVHELRDIMIEHIRGQGGNSRPLSLLFQSFGFKYGVPGDTDFIFDVRCLPNPHWVPELKPLTGQHPKVQSFMQQQPMVEEMLESIRTFLDTWLPRYEAEKRRYIAISIGCNGGQHRSVYLCERLAGLFRDKIDNISVRHRELNK
jgi:UPF0042 nucleotide-binding protein